jgi:hypothetical protein
MPHPPSDSACRSDFPAIYKESAECGVITNMKILFRALAILFVGTSLSPGGQAIYISNEDLVARAQLIAEIEVVNVEKIDVNRKVGVARVYVSTAKVRKVFKGRQPDNTIPILSSTYPNSSAVWPRMKEGRYLAFLVQEQAHYRFGLLWAMREIDAKQSVSWHEGKAGKDLKFIRIMDNPGQSQRTHGIGRRSGLGRPSHQQVGLRKSRGASRAQQGLWQGSARARSALQVPHHRGESD